MKKVTIVSKGKDIVIGSTVNLVKDSHLKDEDAIKVYVDDENVGYLANSPHTLIEGTISATMLKEEFAKTAKAVVKEFIEERNGIFKYYIADLVTEKKAIEELEFQLTGGTTTFPGKMELMKAVKTDVQSVKLQMDGDRIVGIFSGVQAGTVKADEETFELLKQYVEDTPEVLVEAYAAEKGQVSCRARLTPIANSPKTKRIILEKALERIIKEGLDIQKNLDEKLEYLRKSKVPEIAIATLFESYIAYPAEIKVRIPERPKVLYVDTAGLVRDSVAFMNVGDNLRFEGDKGVGKNVLTETLAWLYSRPLYEFSSNSQQSNNSLLGGKTFADNDESSDEEQKSTVWSFLNLAGLFKKIFLKGEKADISESEIDKAKQAVLKAFGHQDKKLIFEMSSILEAFINGGIIVLDEFNTSLAHVMPVFNSLLDDRRRMEITGYGRAVGHKNFVAISTMNRDYEGTFEGNEATMDRFTPVLFPAITTITPILQEKIPGIGYDIAIQANKVYLGLKNAVEAGTMSSQVLSIRGFISACKVLEQGITLKESLVRSVANRVTDIDERNAIIEIIDLQLV